MASVTKSSYVVDLSNPDNDVFNNDILLDQDHSSDSFQSRPRAVICVLPFAKRRIDAKIFGRGTTASDVQESQLGDYLDLANNYIIISSDILSLNVSSDKNNPTGSMSVTLAPDNDVDYMHVFSPGDYVFAWITEEFNVPGLIKKIKNMEACNRVEDRLKFFGQIQNINETFTIQPTGIKSRRFNLNALSFNFYNAYLYYSPFLSFLESQLGFSTIFTVDLMQKVDDYLRGFGEKSVSAHFKLLTYHKLLLGAGPGLVNKNAPLRSPNGTFSVPINVIKLFGRVNAKGGDLYYTISDFMSVLIGVQDYVSGHKPSDLGPDMKLEDSMKSKDRTFGLYFVPNQDNYQLKGKNNSGITPTSNTSIWNVLRSVSNVSLNEMYTTLRVDPNGENTISPTLVCRQLPYCETVIDDDKFPMTNFFSLPRFLVTNSMVSSYNLSRANDARYNFLSVRMASKIATSVNKGNNLITDALTTSDVPFAFDPDDVKRHGARSYNITIDDAYLDPNDTQSNYIKNYTNFLTDIMTNMHLKYSGTIQTKGIFYAVSIGENLEFNDIVFHIEGINHQYQISNNTPIFRTTFTLSHGIHSSSNVDELYLDPDASKFNEIAPGIQKETNYPTEVAPQNSDVAAKQDLPKARKDDSENVG